MTATRPRRVLAGLWNLGTMSELTISGLLQVLCCDWCKYNDCLLATAGVDKALKVWDVRKPHQEVAVLQGHTYVSLSYLIAISHIRFFRKYVVKLTWFVCGWIEIALHY